MAMEGGKPIVICQPLTARQAQRFVQGYTAKGFYIERMPEHIRPGVMAH